MTDPELLKKFSLHLRNSLLLAMELAKKSEHKTLEPIHLFYALTQEKGSIAGEFLTNLKIEGAAIKKIITAVLPNKTGQIKDSLQLSEATEKTIIKAVKISFLNKHKYVGTEHLLIALTQKPDNLITKALNSVPIQPSTLQKQAELILKTTSKLSEILNDFELADSESSEQTKTNTILNFFAQNLTDEQNQQHIDPVIGREAEINRIIEILSRRQKNNPLLLGDPGVGKTAIIEGLAKKIFLGEVPEVLMNKKIYSLDLTSIVAGTSFRGEFESRIKEIISEAENREDVIIFIDEIHQLVGTGSTPGSLDAANILKPALARGRIKVIGATTYQDYRKSLENDAALARRFQTIKIEEPSEPEAKQILIGLKSYFEKFHNIKINDIAIEAAVDLSQKYIGDKLLPDKAIDLLDEASASLKAGKKIRKSEQLLKTALQTSRINKKLIKECIINEDFIKATQIKEDLNKLQQQIQKYQKKTNQENNSNLLTLDYDDIAGVVERRTGIVLSRKNQAGLDFKKLEKNLKQEIIGQNEPIDQILPYLKRAAAGLTDNNKPLASFIFAGPSGVGKTYTAQKIAEHFFGSAKNLIKINMSEYGEKFNASKLIGAPAGYVGYKESGELTEKIKRQPYSLILLDEIEKANPEIFDLFLQILDEGRLTDAAGAKINFKNSVIVMTSNIGSELFNHKKTLGFGETKNESNLNSNIQKAIKKTFKPEFINRLDKIIIFNNLTDQDLTKIANQELKKLMAKLPLDKKIKLSANLLPAIVKFKNNEPLNEQSGARAIQKIIKEKIEVLIADELLDKKTAKKTWRINIKNGIITLS